MILSSSALATYLACHYRYKLEYIWRVPPEPSEAVRLGIEVHEAAEAILNGQEPKVSPQAAPLVAAFQTKVLPTLPEPRWAEWPFVVTVNGQLVSGVIDCIAGKEVHDFKTTDGGLFRARYYRLQLSLYALAYEAHFGERPERCVIDRIDRKGTVRRYEIEPDGGEAADILSIVTTGIRRHEFDPSGLLSGACEWCSVRMHCQYWRQK